MVQTLADFSRPVELQLREQDLREVIGDVLALAADELSTRNVTLESRFPANPLIANVDSDLLKQAALNVIQNGAQAMPEGGILRVLLEEDRKTAVLRIADQGPGIPDDAASEGYDPVGDAEIEHDIEQAEPDADKLFGTKGGAGKS